MDFQDRWRSMSLSKIIGILLMRGVYAFCFAFLFGFLAALAVDIWFCIDTLRGSSVAVWRESAVTIFIGLQLLGMPYIFLTFLTFWPVGFVLGLIYLPKRVKEVLEVPVSDFIESIHREIVKIRGQ